MKIFSLILFYGFVLHACTCTSCNMRIRIGTNKFHKLHIVFSFQLFFSSFSYLHVYTFIACYFLPLLLLVMLCSMIHSFISMLIEGEECMCTGVYMCGWHEREKEEEKKKEENKQLQS